MSYVPPGITLDAECGVKATGEELSGGIIRLDLVHHTFLDQNGEFVFLVYISENSNHIAVGKIDGIELKNVGESWIITNDH